MSEGGKRRQGTSDREVKAHVTKKLKEALREIRKAKGEKSAGDR